MHLTHQGSSLRPIVIRGESHEKMVSKAAAHFGCPISELDIQKVPAKEDNPKSINLKISPSKKATNPASSGPPMRVKVENGSLIGFFNPLSKREFSEIGEKMFNALVNKGYVMSVDEMSFAVAFRKASTLKREIEMVLAEQIEPTLPRPWRINFSHSVVASDRTEQTHFKSNNLENGEWLRWMKDPMSISFEAAEPGISGRDIKGNTIPSIESDTLPEFKGFFWDLNDQNPKPVSLNAPGLLVITTTNTTCSMFYVPLIQIDKSIFTGPYPKSNNISLNNNFIKASIEGKNALECNALFISDGVFETPINAHSGIRVHGGIHGPIADPGILSPRIYADFVERCTITCQRGYIPGMVRQSDLYGEVWRVKHAIQANIFSSIFLEIRQISAGTDIYLGFQPTVWKEWIALDGLYERLENERKTMGMAIDPFIENPALLKERSEMSQEILTEKIENFKAKGEEQRQISLRRKVLLSQAPNPTTITFVIRESTEGKWSLNVQGQKFDFQGQMGPSELKYDSKSKTYSLQEIIKT